MSSEQPQNPPKLHIDFAWRKFRALVIDLARPSEPLYTVHFGVLKAPHIIVKSASSSFSSFDSNDENNDDNNSDGTVVGTGTLHPISINAHYQVHGRRGTLKALKRWQTQYTHLSHAYSSDDPTTGDGALATMTWTTESSARTWNFVCLDENQLPVANFAGNVLGVKKIGSLEFSDSRPPPSPAARDEMVVVALTLFYCMLLRSTSLLSFFGAVFARPGPLKKEDGEGKETKQHQQEGEGEGAHASNPDEDLSVYFEQGGQATQSS